MNKYKIFYMKAKELTEETVEACSFQVRIENTIVFYNLAGNPIEAYFNFVSVKKLNN